ncbi:hypothetical protein LTR53_014245 [Teratosphaeriaceae sp. CCFEE 6253]|nr:hypothetical protein LTR53_014245 [Teratosphaeriaceae sp. CCFEE 6253]
MDALLAAHSTLESSANLARTLTSVDALIHLLQSTRDSVSTHPATTVLHIAKLKIPLKHSFDAIEEDLKEVNKGLNQYQKALKDKFKRAGEDGGVGSGGGGGGGGGGLAGQGALVDRAVAMHLLREGEFDVASTFVKEVREGRRRNAVGVEVDEGMETAGDLAWVDDFADQDDTAMRDNLDGDGADDEELYGEQAAGKGYLQKKFAEMYRILDALRTRHDLTPAIAWASTHSAELESRASNLEFELSRLKFVELYTGTTTITSDDDDHPDFDAYAGPLRALDYARTTFPRFHPRYARETAALLGSLAFSPSPRTSPYTSLFAPTSSSSAADAAATFTHDFTALLALPSTSPLYTATTAGAIALPTLSKVNRIMTASGGQWTSANELPVETPLPPGYAFHSIFVCPVSKEQATDANPPMLLPCGHVLAKESLEQHARGKQRVKCPYCPVEVRAGDARRVFI